MEKTKKDVNEPVRFVTIEKKMYTKPKSNYGESATIKNQKDLLFYVERPAGRAKIADMEADIKRGKNLARLPQPVHL